MKKLYVKLDASGYVSDAVYYQPGDYTEFLGEEKPNDLLNECYVLSGTQFVLDQDKYESLYYDEFGNDTTLPDYIPNS